jgi:hypothetical protein
MGVFLLGVFLLAASVQAQRDRPGEWLGGWIYGIVSVKVSVKVRDLISPMGGGLSPPGSNPCQGQYPGARQATRLFSGSLTCAHLPLQLQ